MWYDGYDSDTAVATASRRRRRREISRSFTCISPWSIFWRWFNGGKSRVSKNTFGERNWGKKKFEGDLVIKKKSETVSSSFRRDVAAETGKAAPFNIGVGVGLIRLVRTELNKMVELRKKIELLLQNFHTEIENQDMKQPYGPSRSSISSSLPKSSAQEILYDEEHRSCQSASQISIVSNQYRREKSFRMDQLEAELEAEFERLQLQMDDGELHLNYPQEQYPEVHMEGNAYEFSNSQFYGVPPLELERKLHEVLETRQQERINELESALGYAMQQLEETERELSCWKDTACPHHLPFVPSLLRQVKQAMGAEYEVKKRGTSLIINSLI